jgi:hypothetical protein
MQQKEKQKYSVPSTMIIEVTQEGVICVSDPTFNTPFDPEEDW